MGLSMSLMGLLGGLVEGQGSGLYLADQRVEGQYLYLVRLQALLFKISGWVDWRDYEVWARNSVASCELLRQTKILSVYVKGEGIYFSESFQGKQSLRSRQT